MSRRHGTKLIKSIQATTKKSLPENHNVRIILTDTKLGSLFSIKYDTNKQHKHHLVYFRRCPPTYCNDSYLGETAWGPSERVVDQAGRDTKPHIVRHSLNSNYETVNIENFKIINVWFNNNAYTRRVSEELFVKQYCLSLKVEDDPVPLDLFN